MTSQTATTRTSSQRRNPGRFQPIPWPPIPIIPTVTFLSEAVGWRNTYHVVGLASDGGEHASDTPVTTATGVVIDASAKTNLGRSRVEKVVLPPSV